VVVQCGSEEVRCLCYGYLATFTAPNVGLGAEGARAGKEGGYAVATRPLLAYPLVGAPTMHSRSTNANKAGGRNGATGRQTHTQRQASAVATRHRRGRGGRSSVGDKAVREFWFPFVHPLLSSGERKGEVGHLRADLVQDGAGQDGARCEEDIVDRHDLARTEV